MVEKFWFFKITETTIYTAEEKIKICVICRTRTQLSNKNFSEITSVLFWSEFERDFENDMKQVNSHAVLIFILENLGVPLR